MVRWSKEAREANKAARERLAEQAAQDAFNENVLMNMSTAQKRSVDSPPRQISKSRRSNRKKANTGSTPPSKDNNESVTVSNSSKQDLDTSITSQDTTKPIDILRQQHALIMQCLSLRLPSTYTDDGFIHAIAIMLDVKVNFMILLNEVKAQLLEDFIFVLSDPEFKRNTLYTRKNLETIAMFVNIQPEFPPQLTSRNIKNNVDKLLQEIVQKKGAKIVTIPNLGWTEMCKLTGVFLSPNSIEPLDKVPLVKKVLSAIRQCKPQLLQWYNKHALSHMSYYFGHETRPVANNSTDYMVPPFYTDATVEAEFRRDGYYKLLEVTEGPCPNFSNYKTLSWCASGNQCTVDIFDASTTICSQCAVPVHPQCSSLLKKEYYCFSCHPDRSRHSWYCYTESYIELPLARSAPTHTVNNEDDDSQAMSEGEEVDHSENQATVSGENEFDDVNDTEETNRDVNREDNQELEDDDASVVRRLNLDDQNTKAGTSTLNSSPQRDNNTVPEDETEFTPPDPLTPSYTSYYEQGFYISRIDLSLTLVITTKNTRSDEEKFIDAAKIFLSRLLTIDDKISILPWKENTNLPPLNIENLDPDFDDIQVYFNRARVLEDNLKVYCDARVKHEMSWDALAITMRNWLQTNNTGMYYKKLQVESTRVLGWMLWSHRHIKVDRLAHVLANDDDLHLFFRYSKIYLGKGEKFALNEGVKAIFAVCDAKDFEFYSTALKIIYHRSVTHFPLGIKLRFMPQVMNADEDLLITQQKFRAQQEQFLASIVTASSMDIRLLDASVGGKKTLRNVIMNLTHPNGIQMFLSVDTQWNNTARHIFAFTKNHEKNAIRMVNTLPAYLNRLKQQDVLPYFTIEAIEKSSKLQWDEKRQWFMTPDEIYYFEMDMFEGAANFGIAIDPQTTEASNTIGNVAARVSTIEANSTRVERIHAGTEACSIGTVASKAKRHRMTGHMESDSEKDNSSIGSSTTANKSSRSEKEQKLERKLEVLTANQSETTRTLADLTVLLNKVLGMNVDKTIRVQEPNDTNTVTPASGNPTTTTTFAAGSTAASGAAK